MEMHDAKTFSEFYSELLTFTPAVLQEGVSKGDPFERFKITINYAFSILHTLTTKDMFSKRPLIPIIGETFESYYVLNGTTNIFMETDYKEYEI